MAHTDDLYRVKVAGVFERLFASHKFDDPAFKKILIQAIVECFHLPGFTQNSSQQASILLDELFGFSVSDFIQTYLFDNEVVAQKLISELLYGLYYGGISLDAYKDDFEFLVIQVLAEIASVEALLSTWSHDKLVRFICFLFRLPREGTFRIIKELDPRFHSLVFWLRRNYYDVEYFAKLIADAKEIDEKVFTRIIGELESYAEEQTEEFYTGFKELVPMLVASVSHMYKNFCAFVDDPAEQEAARQQMEQLKSGFDPFYVREFTVQDFQEFTRLFGLRSYPSVFAESPDENTCVVKKVKSLSKIVSGLYEMSRSITSLLPPEVQSLFSFVFTVIAHLDATVLDPRKYREGITKFTCSIATCGKELSKEAAVASVVEGYQTLVDFLEAKINEKIPIKYFPIVVFDQSEDSLFKKNSLYIDELNRQYQSSIIHVSKQEAVDLAKRIGIEKLVVTTPSGSFGYGGGRNCQFLLTALVCSGFKMGKKNVREIIDLPQELLTSFYEERVLGGVEKNVLGDLLFIVDDDMLVADTNIFSCALLAEQCKDNVLGGGGIQYGRGSKYNLLFWDLAGLLEAPEMSHMFPDWLNFPTPSGMSEQISRPKVCLNLPQGNEEHHYLSLVKGHLFLQPSYHLCGSRYPNKEMPTHFFVGLDAHFEKATPYVLLLYLTATLLAPLCKYTATALPWNVERLSSTFINLRQGFAFIADEQNKKQLKENFWIKVQELFKLQLKGYEKFLGVIYTLMDCDVDAICTNFQQKSNLTEHEMHSLAKLSSVYKASQVDMKLFWQFGGMLADSNDPEAQLDEIRLKIENEAGKSINNFPLTQGLYLMACSLGRGEFCDIIGHATK